MEEWTFVLEVVKALGPVGGVAVLAVYLVLRERRHSSDNDSVGSKLDKVVDGQGKLDGTLEKLVDGQNKMLLTLGIIADRLQR